MSEPRTAAGRALLDRVTLRDLVALVRIGFLATVAGERPVASDIHGSTGDLLMSVLSAANTQAAVERIEAEAAELAGGLDAERLIASLIPDATYHGSELIGRIRALGLGDDHAA